MKPSIIIGVDPGAGGGLARRVCGVLKDIQDMPIIEEKVGKTMRPRVNASLLAALLREWVSGHSAHIACEKVGPTPHDGVAGAFAFGRAAGLVEMAAAALCVPYSLISPAEWHKGMSCSKDKNANRSRACQLYPSWAGSFGRVKDDGRAEAALIADYYERHLGEMLR